IYVIDGDGSVLASQQLESGLVGDFKAQNSSVSIADVDNDLQYDIYLATRNYLWGFGYEPGSKQLIAKFPKRPIDQLPTRWPETTPALGDIDGDGDLDVALGVGQGRVTAIDATEGTVLPGFPVRVAPVTSTKIGSPILMNLDSDLAAEIVVGDNGGVVYALDGDGTMMIGFPYFTGGRIQHGLAAWDVDRDGHPNLLIQAEQQPAVTILDIDNVNFPADLAAAMAANPWPSFRHDARNTGRQDAAVITPVRTLAAEASGEAGAALLIWSTQEPVEVFRIERRDAMGGWELRASGVASDFGSDGSYSYRDPAAPVSYTHLTLPTSSE
ncbi:MAG: hypothetical protein QUU85_11625, partial [Candidatus Eisenbacteria bacterium]|nr:hypothetical protein [Candidatus Eisenbacteria bacterium]